MPALRMKAKQITRLSEGHCLDVCHKPVKASKNSSCRVEALRLAGVLNNIQNSHDAISLSGSPDRSCKLPEVIAPRDSCDGSSDQNSGFLSDSLSIVCEGLQPMPAFETIFSPTVQINDTNFRPINNNEAESCGVHAGLPRLIDDSDDGCCSATDYKFSELLDYLSLDFNPFMPYGGGLSFSDLINSSSPEYDHISSGLTFDIDRGCTVLPSFEKKLDTLCEGCSDNELPSLDQSVTYLAISQLRQPDQGAESNFYLREGKDSDCFSPQLFLDNTPDASETISPLQEFALGKETWKKKHVTLVLDLDGLLDPLGLLEYTVIHEKDYIFALGCRQNTCTVVLGELNIGFCSYNYQAKYLHRCIGRVEHRLLQLQLSETLVHSCLEHCDSADFTFSICIDNEYHTVYVRQRPYLDAFLARVAQMFDVVIFTASQSIYAAQLLDKLDPNKNLISKRIYRESCTFSGGSYTKDLTILGIDLAKVAIIDNSPQVFQLQVNNGIPIKSWFDDPADCALISLLPFLETLVDADDVRPLITNFNNKGQLI